MHVGADLDRRLQFLVSAAEEMTASMAAAFLNLIRSTSYTVLSAAFNYGSTSGDDGEMTEAAGGEAVEDRCAPCSLTLGRQLGGCEVVKYCSEGCQSSHCNSEHEDTKSPYALRGGKVSLLSAVGSSDTPKHYDKILFPYEKFVRFFNWEKPGYPPCGLKNYGNSCFVNVVLQCLAYTRPLAAYLLEEGHKIKCQMDMWCFMCAFQTHMERVSWSFTSFIPSDILSQLHNIGGNLEHGKEEDAHEFLRFAIDKMQSAFLNEFGGEMAAHPRYQETSLVQHIFGGCLQSQVICNKCNNVSVQFEHMMDLTVEINGDAESLEECLNRFTAEEWLYGDNMYKCDCCSAYVMARKRLGIHQAPNILTIALKRFQTGRFNQLNKGITFPETLDLRSYMTELEDGNDVYKLYAVIVHVETFSVSHCGHYICYVKDICGNWYRVDDDKVSSVGLNEVLSQGAYMLLYSRICPRPSGLLPAALLKEQENKKVKIQIMDPSTVQPVNTVPIPPPKFSEVKANCGLESSFLGSSNDTGEDVKMESFDAFLPTVGIESHHSDGMYNSPKEGFFPLKLDCYKTSAGYDDVEDALQYNRRYANGSLLRKRNQDSGATKCTVEKDRRYDTCSFAGGEAQREKSASCMDTRGNAECEGNKSVSPDDGYIDTKLNPIFGRGSIGNRAPKVYSCDENAAAKVSTGLSPLMKLKPLSALGGKRRRELFKQQNRISVALGPKIHLNRWSLFEDGVFYDFD